MAKTECNGKPGCTVHPHIRFDHPIGAVAVEVDGQTVMHGYSDEWELAEAEWEYITNTPMGKYIMENLHIPEGP